MNKFSEKRLFTACFVALMATSFIFMFRAMFITQWGFEFNLSETQKGEILGVGLWPFAISIVLFSLIVDKVGYGKVMGFAFVAHVVSIVIILFAKGYSMLYIGTFIMALGNGAVEAAINPMVASLFPLEKIKRLSMLHAAWPGGMVIGGILAIILGNSFVWQVKFSLVLIPVIIYGIFLLKQHFPLQERVKAGVSYHDMLNELGIVGVLIIAYLIVSQIGTVFGFSLWIKLFVLAFIVGVSTIWIKSLGRPLFIILMLIMLPLATTELGTDSWIIDLMTPGMKHLGLNAAWILIYTASLMTIMRLLAGKIVKKISPLTLLAMSSGVAAVGLFGLSQAEGIIILLAATVFGIAKSFFWPTMLGLASEQFPRGGALAINVIAGTGMIGVGIIGTVLLGYVQDTNFDKNLLRYDAQNMTQLHNTFVTVEKKSIVGAYKMLDMTKVANASKTDKQVMNTVQQLSKKTALKSVAILPVFMMAVYLLLGIWFRRHGGYKSVPVGEKVNI